MINYEMIPSLVGVAFISVLLLNFAIWALIELDTELYRYHEGIRGIRDITETM